jgi:hypothetical protein
MLGLSPLFDYGDQSFSIADWAFVSFGVGFGFAHTLHGIGIGVGSRGVSCRYHKHPALKGRAWLLKLAQNR